jgi:acyl carrier protein
LTVIVPLRISAAGFGSAGKAGPVRGDEAGPVDREAPAGDVTVGLDGVEFAMEVEERFDLDIPGPMWQQIHTVGEVVALVHDMLRSAGREMDRAAVSAQVCKIASEQSGLKIDKISEESELWKIFGYTRTDIRESAAGSRYLLPPGRRKKSFISFTHRIIQHNHLIPAPLSQSPPLKRLVLPITTRLIL